MKLAFFSIVLVFGAGAAIANAPKETPKSNNCPQFRGVQASGIAEGKALPIKWDVEKGEGVLWERTALKGVPKVQRHTKSTHASPTMATDGRKPTDSHGLLGQSGTSHLRTPPTTALASGFLEVPHSRGKDTQKEQRHRSS